MWPTSSSESNSASSPELAELADLVVVELVQLGGVDGSVGVLRDDEQVEDAHDAALDQSLELCRHLS